MLLLRRAHEYILTRPSRRTGPAGYERNGVHLRPSPTQKASQSRRGLKSIPYFAGTHHTPNPGWEEHVRGIRPKKWAPERLER